MSGNVSCPYCGEVLETRPKRKKKCPYCGEYMYVRRGNPYTEKGVEEYDWKQRLENQFDYTSDEYDKAKQVLEAQFGHEPKTRDVVWSVFNKLVVTGGTERVYLAMANSVEEEGKDPTRFYDQHREFRAKEIKDAIIGIQGRGYKFVKYRNCNDELVCESCRRWEEEKIPIEQALSEMKIPNLCHSELRYCRCFVLPWIDYSEEDDEPLSDFRWNTEGEEEVVEEKRSWLDRLLGRY